MSITRINTNYDAMFASNQISKLEATISKASQKLSTGKRINTSSDDPHSIAALSYATGQMRGNRVAIQNIQDTKALAEYADSALSSIEDKLLRMRDVSAKLANDATLSAGQVTALQNEFTGLANGFSAGANAAVKWNGVAVIDNGIAAGDFIHVGATASAFISGTMLSIGGVDATSLGVNAAPAAGTAAATMMSTIDGALSTVATARANAGIMGRLLDSMLEGQMAAEVANAATVSSLGDANLASEVTTLATAQILAQAATAMLGQANVSGSLILGLL